MNDRAPASLHMLTIAAVERDTRIGKDTLRVWERRYGFPSPERDHRGERIYPPEQVEQLRHIKRLLDAGWRPGRIVGRSLDDLQALGETGRSARSPSMSPEDAGLDAEPQSLYTLLRAHDVSGLRRTLMRSVLRRGMGPFVTDVAIPLLVEIGQAWSRGHLDIFEEHLCSEAMETVLRSAIASAPETHVDGAPRVLLGTFPDEQHGLALLMAEALFTVEGCPCMNLGRQTPLQELVKAAQAHRADIVVVSFSAVSPTGAALDQLADLRQRLPPEVALWAGTPLAAMQRRAPAGVLLLTDLGRLDQEIAHWCSQRRTSP
jgi:methylmalonyl-CoA mutase cobalamin-binding subunit